MTTNITRHNNHAHGTRNQHRTSVRQLMNEIYPQLLIAANRAGIETGGWSFGTPYGHDFYLRDGEYNICDGWKTTHDAKVGMQSMTYAFRLIANARVNHHR